MSARPFDWACEQMNVLEGERARRRMDGPDSAKGPGLAGLSWLRETEEGDEYWMWEGDGQVQQLMAEVAAAASSSSGLVEAQSLQS